MTYSTSRELEDEELLFSVEQAKDFFESLVWKEIERTVNERIYTNSIDMEDVPSIEALRVIQGDSKSCRFFLEQPRLILMQLEGQMEEKAEAKKEEGD